MRQSGLTWVGINSNPVCTNECVEAPDKVHCQPAPTQADIPYSHLQGAELMEKVNEIVEWWLAKKGLTREQALRQYDERLKAEFE